MKRIKFILVFYFISTLGNAQELLDTIYTNYSDTIPCQIISLNDYSIFYKYKNKKKKVRKTEILQSQVYSFVLNSSEAEVYMKKNNGKISEKNTEIIDDVEVKSTSAIGFAENDGIIYSANVDQPPKYPGGINSLYTFLERSVKVYPRDAKIFDQNKAIVLFEIIIMSTGNIEYAGIYESCVQSGGFDYKAEILEKEILNKICLAGNWIPGIIDGEKVNMNVYIPILFLVDDNRIIIYPSKYLTVFKKRRKK